MKKAFCRKLVWTALLLVAATTYPAESDLTNRLSISSQPNILTNRLSLSARFGFNISGKFKDIGGGLFATPPVNSRRTPPQPGRPNGDPYNYDNGYVLTDISGNFGGETTYWGYDDSASQISGNTILLSRAIANSTVSGKDKDADPSYGGELVYNRFLRESGSKRYGMEVAFNYQSINFSDNSSYSADLTRATDAYPFEAGTTPPAATPANPYQGSFLGPGFLLGDTPVGPGSISVVPGGMVITGTHRFDANLWGFRCGPYLEFPVTERINVSLSAGLALGWLDAEVSWSESGAIPGGGSVRASGHDSEFDTLWGGYARVDATYDLGKNWSLLCGLQYQSLGDYDDPSFDGRRVKLDMRNSIYLTVGLGKSF